MTKRVLTEEEKDYLETFAEEIPLCDCCDCMANKKELVDFVEQLLAEERKRAVEECIKITEEMNYIGSEAEYDAAMEFATSVIRELERLQSNISEEK